MQENIGRTVGSHRGAWISGAFGPTGSYAGSPICDTLCDVDIDSCVVAQVGLYVPVHVKHGVYGNACI